MSETINNKKGKVLITGQIELLTGLHIGSGGQNGIGLVDSPVIRNPLNNEPYIPGSSLKGRLRYSLDMLAGTNSLQVKNLFGSVPDRLGSATNEKNRCTSLVYVRDSHLSKESKNNKNLSEIKYENTIDRLTGTTKTGGLRQIERVVAGAKFDFEVVYCVENSYEEDLKALESCFEFLEDEYLGASGSRGYGKVKFYFHRPLFKSLEFYKSLKDSNDCNVAESLSSKFAEEAINLIQNQNEKV